MWSLPKPRPPVIIQQPQPEELEHPGRLLGFGILLVLTVIAVLWYAFCPEGPYTGWHASFRENSMPPQPVVYS